MWMLTHILIPHYSSTWGYCIGSSNLLPVINREFLFKNVEKNTKTNMCFLQQLTSKQETSTQYQGKLQVCAAERGITASGCSTTCTTGAGKVATEGRTQCITVSEEKQRLNPKQWRLDGDNPLSWSDYTFYTRNDAKWDGSYRLMYTCHS